ncbi:MAG: flavodoxin family protein [Desulfopila sp.]
MKAVALLASPRKKGNSNGLAESLTSILAVNGYEITPYYLNDLHYRGCQACNACKTRSESCVLLDDLRPVLEDIKNADVVIMASPVYWGDVSAPLKGFIDRSYSYLTPEFVTGPLRHRLPEGKKLVFILSQAADEAMYDDIFSRYTSIFDQIGLFEKSYLIRGCELSERGDYQEKDEALDAVDDTVDSLLE